MEQQKRGRGRPRIDATVTEVGAPSRRQAINAMYMLEGVQLLSVAATEIPDRELLWHSDNETQTVKSKNGILEQLGRMLLQDHFSEGDCVYIANLAIAALQNGKTSREIEKAIREIRLAMKRSEAEPENKRLLYLAGCAVTRLKEMGDCSKRPPP